MNYKFSTLTAEDTIYSWPCVSPLLLESDGLSDIKKFQLTYTLISPELKMHETPSHKIGEVLGSPKFSPSVLPDVWYLKTFVLQICPLFVVVSEVIINPASVTLFWKIS